MKKSKNTAEILAQMNQINQQSERLNSKNYDWKEFIDFVVWSSPNQIAKNLLLVHFELTNYYLRDDNASGSAEVLGDALMDLQFLYSAFRRMEESNGTSLKFTASCEITDK